jgi:2'-5' RNA ligase
MKPTLRTFLAVEIDLPVRDRAESLIRQFRTVPADVKWVDRQNLHLTLKFLGDVPVTDTPQIIQAITMAVAETQPFQLEIHGAGAFPDLRRPRTLWFGVRAGAEPMVALHRQVESALKKLHYPPEGRKFSPHLTIGRVRDGGPALADLGRLLQEHAEADIGHTPVKEVVVFASHLDPTGPTYEALGRAPLAERP